MTLNPNASVSRMALRALVATIGVLIGVNGSCLSAQAAGWVTWEVSSGGNGHSYLAVPGFTGLTWMRADQRARAEGGYLATLTSEEENAFVFSLVDDPQFWTVINGSGPALGGLRSDGPGSVRGWGWVTGESFAYSNWYPGPLNTRGNPFADRLQFFSGIPGSPGATWNALGQSDENLGGFVIEVESPIAQIERYLPVLVDAGALTQHEAEVLLSKMHRSETLRESGQGGAACNHVEAFINQVGAYVESRRVTVDQAQQLAFYAKMYLKVSGCTITCSDAACGQNGHCIESPTGAQCVVNTCADITCDPGLCCHDGQFSSFCMPPLTCESVDCAEGSHCVDGPCVAVCVPN